VSIPLLEPELRADEGAKTRIEYEFDPSAITIDRQVPRQEHKYREDDLPSQNRDGAPGPPLVHPFLRSPSMIPHD
jgi:hypothetical protein